jgi:hypothetical protein
MSGLGGSPGASDIMLANAATNPMRPTVLSATMRSPLAYGSGA